MINYDFLRLRTHASPGQSLCLSKISLFSSICSTFPLSVCSMRTVLTDIDTMKKSSSGALTAQQKAEQDQRYGENHQYDYVIIGTGSAALTVGALLAHAGKKICMLEAHDLPGGYCQTFRAGDYHFCAQVHYIWGCAPGGKIYEFLKHIGLEKDITFSLFDKE